MQVVVKKPHIKIEGEITDNLVKFLYNEFHDLEVIEDEDNELVEVIKSDWYHDTRATISPGENLKVYRKLHNLTQTELGKKLGNFSRQNISNIENGHRPVSKVVAKKLAEIFDVSVKKFLY